MDNQSIWGQAWKDAWHFHSKPGWFWGCEVLGVLVFTFLSFYLSPITVDSPKYEIALYGGIGAVGGLVVAFLLIYLFF